MKPVKVTAVVVIYGNRWQFLSQVVTAVMKDAYIAKLIIVDNGSKNKEEIEEGTRGYGDRIEIIRHDRNLGSAGGFAAGIKKARDTDCDFVFLLDDDSVPEEGSIARFLQILELFDTEKIVLSGNRASLLENKEYFYKPSILKDEPRGTFFEVFSFKKFVHFLRLSLMNKKRTVKRGPFIPVIPVEGFIYGGAFIPVAAIREAELPDTSLFLYGDDVEYSWKIKNLGYGSYLCARPKLHDVDMTFGDNSSHLFGQFDPQTAPFKVYYRIRNMVLLSRRHSKQGRISLFLNIFFWMLGLYILGLIKYGPVKTYFERVALMSKAVYGGYFPSSAKTKKVESSFSW